MSDTIERIHLTVDDATYPLAPLENVTDLERQVLAAAHAGGGFLRVTLDGGQRLSIFVSSVTVIIVASSTMSLDSADADGQRDVQPPQFPDEFDDGAPYDYI